jgi:hypothetical protein
MVLNFLSDGSLPTRQRKMAELLWTATLILYPNVSNAFLHRHMLRGSTTSLLPASTNNDLLASFTISFFSVKEKTLCFGLGQNI